MPGMGRDNVTVTNSLIVSMFRHDLLGVAIYWIVGLGVVLLLVAVMTQRVGAFNLSREGLNEPRSRTYLRIAFGCLWLIDGVLQFQPGMPLGLANEVVKPTVAGAPSWLQPLQIHAINLWNAHPIALATGTAWLEIGIGLALLVANGSFSRVVGVVAVGWAGLIWLVGAGAGGAFAPASSILFGWPGATLFYFVAGVWLAVPPGYYARYFSPFALRLLAIILVVAIVLQSLPSGSFWHGGNSNALTKMSRTMTESAQPHALSWIVLHVGDLAGTIGGGFNLIVIVWLAVCAGGLWYASTHSVNWPITVLIVGCVFFWIASEDTAIFGGVGTDINSLIPLAILAWCARPALRGTAPLERRLPAELRSSSGAVAASFAAAMVLFSVVSMGVASVSAAESSLYLAQNGQASAADSPAAPFTLTDQFDHTYALGEHAGRYTLLAFLDPVCYTDCPLLAAQLKAVRADLGASAKIDVVAVAANPLHQTLANVRHFIAIHNLTNVNNFYFLTGKTRVMKKVWADYGISVTNTTKSRMSIHSNYLFIISPKDYVRWIIPDNPIANVAGQQSSESQLLSLLRQSGL